VLPGGASAVVKVEHTDARGERVLVRRGVVAGENVMSAGDDLMLGDVALPAGTRLAPADIGVLAAAGEIDVEVWRRPTVGIVSTGDEVRPAGAELEPGQIHDVNGPFLAAAVERAGGLASALGIVRDDRQEIEAALLAATSSCDLVLSSGSTSAGAGDVVYRILQERGELLVHGIKLEPGKPTVIARLAGVPFFGLPGNPASAAVVFETLVAPLLRSAGGVHASPERLRLRASLTSDIRPAPGRHMLRMVGVVGRGETARAYPVEKRSGAISLLAQADGFVEVPEDAGRVVAGSEVEVWLFQDRAALPDALLMGSHCLGLRPLFTALAPLVTRSVHVGSLGGVRAVARGIADAAGVHLREPDGSYNVAALERMGIAGVVLVRGYRRRQGWIVAAGNPRGWTGIAGLVDGGGRIVNRVAGSGTRILLDELLGEEARRRGVPPSALAGRLAGFDVEAASHSAVAAAVKAGLADCGLGIEAAASLNGLGFVPVAEERYDFLLRTETLGSPFGEALRRALPAASFRAAIELLPGYHADPSGGEVVWRAGPHEPNPQ
nr:molybdopterin biosynthesis protein [Gemmatimonadota bacterium]